MAGIETTSLNIYQLERDCKVFGTHLVVLPKDQALDSAVQETLDANATSEFAIASYRLTLSGDVATIDLRHATGSDRLFTSLSDCEQQALFGSLRRTLMDNGQLGVAQVRFMSQGKELRL
jgi:hypothetical protein